MNDNNKPPNMLSDLALERVMRDVLGGLWEISPDQPEQKTAQASPSHNNSSDELKND
jgi:hypothetical protein